MSKQWYVGEIRDTEKRAEQLAKSGLYDFAPAILTCAITGGLHGKEANENLPEAIEEQVQQTIDAYNAGAVMVHIHTRDPQNYKQMSPDPKSYMEINARIREKCPDIIINNTFIGCRIYGEAGASPVMNVSAAAKPEVASLDITSGEWPGLGLMAMSRNDLEGNLNAFAANEIKPELECFSINDIKLGKWAIGKGLVKAPFWWQLIVGGTGVFPCVENLLLAERMLPAESLMGVVGIGAAQTSAMVMSLVLGHHIRVGLEDNVYYGKGELAKSNAQLVERAVRIARDLGRPLATPAQAREMMGLGQPRNYSMPS